MSDKVKDRLLDIDVAAASAFQLEVLERVSQGRGRVPTPYRVWLHCPEIAEGMERIGTYLNNDVSLSDAEAEIVVLSIAAFWQSPYMLANHTKHSLKAGLPDEAVSAMREGRKPKLADIRQQLVADFTWAALDKKQLDDAQFAAIEQAFGRRGIAEMLVLAGYYTSVALALKFHDLPSGGA